MSGIVWRLFALFDALRRIALSDAFQRLSFCTEVFCAGASGNENPADPENQGWLEKFVTGGGSSLTLAFLCNKALFPVRAPVTIGLTPMVARWALVFMFISSC